MLNKIHAHYLVINSASGKVMEKIGMEQEGYFKQHVIKDGTYHDIIQYGLLRDDYIERIKNG